MNNGDAPLVRGARLQKSGNAPLRSGGRYDIIYAVFTTFGRGAVVAQLTVNQLVAGSNPAARAKFMIPHDGGDPVSTGHVEIRLRAEDVGWPR